MTTLNTLNTPASHADLADILDNIEAAATRINDRLLITQKRLHRAVGVSYTLVARWRTEYRVPAARLRVGRALVNGWLYAWPIEDAIRVVGDWWHHSRTPKTWHRWTRADDEYLLEHLGPLGVARCAAHLGVSIAAVHNRVHRRFEVNTDNMDGLWQPGEFARWLPMNRTTMGGWLLKGMPAFRRGVAQGDRLIDPVRACRWILKTPWLRVPFDDASLTRIRAKAALPLLSYPQFQPRIRAVGRREVA